MATPPLSVVAVFTPPANEPLAPLPGTVNVTVVPTTGLLLASLTVACRLFRNVVLTVVLCGVPAVAVIVDEATGTRISVILRLYLSPVGAVSLIVTTVPLAEVVLVCRWTQYVSPAGERNW